MRLLKWVLIKKIFSKNQGKNLGNFQIIIIGVIIICLIRTEICFKLLNK